MGSHDFDVARSGYRVGLALSGLAHAGIVLGLLLLATPAPRETLPISISLMRAAPEPEPPPPPTIIETPPAPVTQAAPEPVPVAPAPTPTRPARAAPARTPAAAAPAAPASDPNADYAARVIAEIRRQRARVEGIGVAVVGFIIDAKGEVTTAEITRSSGQFRLDAAALRIVRAARPGPPPDGSFRGTTTVTFAEE